MPHVFKPTYTNKKTGKIETTKCYTARIHGKRYPLKVTDKRVAERKAFELLRQIEEGGDPDKIRRAIAAPINDHLEAFERSLDTNGRSRKHVSLVVSRLRSTFEGCSVKKLEGVQVADIERWLVQQHNTRKISAQTRKHYATHLRQFGRYLMQEELVPKNPFATVRTHINVESDRRLERRSLSPEEFRRLLMSVAKSDRVQCKLSGIDRRMLYWLARTTGLRRNELGSRTHRSFSLDSEPATVTVVASCTKNGKPATLPLRSDLAMELKSWLTTKPTNKALFPISDRPTNVMIRKDLNDAEIEQVVLGRQCDFHALRVTMVTHLALQGVPLATAQKLARHSTPVLTANAYTQLGLDELKKAVEALPASAGDGESSTDS